MHNVYSYVDALILQKYLGLLSQNKAKLLIFSIKMQS